MSNRLSKSLSLWNCSSNCSSEHPKLITRLIWKSSLLIVLVLMLHTSSFPQLITAQTGTVPFLLDWSASEIDQTSSVAWGDYDGDGDLDLAVGNGHPTYGPQPNLLYRNDNGILTTSPIWTSTEVEITSSVAWGDYDGDGDLDLAFGNWGQPNHLYRNQNGNFMLVWSSNESDDTYSLDWGDYDMDGDLDLAVGNENQSNRLYRNDENALILVWSSTEQDATNSIDWGDYDGDGDLDLAVGNGHPFYEAQSNRVYRNDSGQLTLDWSSIEVEFTSSIAWGDYDNDGDLDLVAGNGNSDASVAQPNRVYRHQENTLMSFWVSSESDATNSVAWGDYDGDGDLDLAVGNGTLQGQPNRLYGNNSNGFSLVWSSTESEDTRSVAWGDYNGDNTLDLVTGGDGEPNRLYRNVGSLLTTNPIWSSNETDTTSSVAWGDYDGDGHLDLVAGNNGQPNRLYRNDSGFLTNNDIWSLNKIDSIWSTAWGDYDNDGDLDLALGNWAKSNRLYRNANGVLSQNSIWSSFETDTTTSVAWGDYDNDGDLDLAVGNWKLPNRLYRNDNEIMNLIWSSEEADDTFSVAWGDYDKDGDLDLAAGGTDVPIRLYRNDGGALSSRTVWSSIEANNTWSVVWGDYDGDGDLDLAVGNGSQPNRVYRNDDGELRSLAIWSSVESSITTSLDWGDYDGDGDLDLAVGNSTQANQVYRNDGGTLTPSAVWSSDGAAETSSIAWGDYDGDGDLDLAVGNHQEANLVYKNLRHSDLSGVNDPPYVTISRPGVTDDANYYSTPHIIQDVNIPISYTLFDPEGDPVPKIFPEYSPTGGGQWFAATPDPGGDGLTNLTASPNGTPHTFIWHTEADLIKSDNVVFRIRAHPNYTHSPILWPALDGKSPPFRVAAPWYIKVVNDRGNVMNNATVYADSQPVGTTNQAGLLNPGQLPNSAQLVALAQQDEQPTTRDAHDGWAYRTYLTNVTNPFLPTESGEQRLVVNQPLVLFNLVISVEWDATEAYLAEIKRAGQAASDYLYDLTDGQMVFGQVAIYDNGEFWTEADVQISTKNIVHPHAYIGGIVSEDKSHVIRLGRGWDGNSGNQGPWDQPDGFRTLAHEFGHYGLHLYDEYFGYTFDSKGNLTGEVSAYCTEPYQLLDPNNEATNASAMYYQYTASELSAQGVDGLWSPLCEETAQWQLNGESAWETLIRKYSDSQEPARWQFTTPMSRGSVLAGPNNLSNNLLPFPVVTIHNAGSSEPPRRLTVREPGGQGYQNAIVALYKQSGDIIGQGFTNNSGQLDIYGAEPGDDLRASSFDSGLSGKTTVTSGGNLTLELTPVAALAAQTMGGIPHMRVIPEPSQHPDQIDLLIALQNFGSGADPDVSVTEPNSEVSLAPTTWHYSATSDTYEGQVSFSAVQQGTWRVKAIGAVGNTLLRLQSTYRLQRVLNEQNQDVYSDDGNLSLHLEPDSLPGSEAYFAVMPPGAIPGPLPTGLTLVGDAYDITASGALVTLEQPGVLTLHYDGALVNTSSAPEELGLYHWEPNSETWQEVPATLDEKQRALVAPVMTLGTYALLALPQETPQEKLYLPLIIKE